MKKLFIYLIALTLMLSMFTGCTDISENDNDTDVSPVATETERASLINEYVNIAESQKAQNKYSSYYIYDIDKDGLPELITDTDNTVYTYKDGTLSTAGTIEGSLLCSYPDGNGIISVTFIAGYTGSQISLNGNTLESELIFDYVDYASEEASEFETNPVYYFEKKYTWDPGTEVANSAKLNPYPCTDLSGIKCYFKEYTDTDTAYTDVIENSEYKEYILYDIDSDGYKEILLYETERGWDAYCYGLIDNKLVNLGLVSGKYGHCHYDGNGIIGISGGTGHLYCAYYYLKNNSLHISKDLYLTRYNTFNNSDEFINLYSYNGNEITSEEFDAIHDNYVTLTPSPIEVF